MMDPRVKQVLLIGGFGLSVAGIGAALYFAFFRPVVAPSSLPVSQTTPSPTTSGSLPSAGSGAPAASGTVGTKPTGTLPPADVVAHGGVTVTAALTAGPVADVMATESGANFYDPVDGRFYRIDAAGNKVALSDAQFPKASDVAWNKDATKAVIEFPDGSNVAYDFATKTQVTLPGQWQDFRFSPADGSIVAKSVGSDPGNRYLVTSDADGGNVKPIQALGDNADKVVVVPSANGQVVAFADTADPLSGGLDRKLIIPIGKNNENFKGLTVEGLGFLPLWSPDGNTLLYSAAGAGSSYKPELWLVDGSAANMGDNRRTIGLQTWADKCAFAGSQALFCAVPVALPDNVGLQRALAARIPDQLFKVDLGTGATSLVAVPQVSTTMTNLSVSPDQGTAFFTNAATGKLESIRLK
jgi:hypothetical protein